ncbi:glycerol-3-phosphate 1-O-acyltransferase PlsY [Leuconostoc mesenteroides]|uniref:Glycerol-3-phosphate acyltransferase n=1 Tax=Leuconostoc mesenteroides subsp. mesenteroides (strain ATCC 8293 / DSM 20343 / BCRC 11652 / CCM 1803 / JCM 6124 / NCDO 523 / NBRC 100496 / NCIMB 8023 / NCTC 12954 / NRRL B-1118 / 37Y) TaxID=203120 RepID=Q03WG4_LEUMM|nr:glycerol-3-phosphate 1-O-acyltransferase PlsY [Leuconostoc mesenteroides]ABJ62458.1 acyl-phosphate glycerol-3-phosphate acyltransferase [Leuconostoc mesenteroides subsp. mesenteroides ATCC 8293]MCT3042821.1 glycerol-3-phosphate 1-O-acyltransferase PlsY [Leuconostoc mesenteroides]MDG9747020.1 glycerol-3-phosphate 1-O-acyltransferase PlsY [Leuconostoc mesenteroides]QQB30765.1 glycerol-3-phosphate 1-O-acyltransferase PlsY [Leuconostoc mesenteroides]STY37523.1 G3P acyltransferase [Leuconostoc m
MFTTILMFILSYLSGSLVPGFWVGKIFYHKDIRDEGSGNIGTTNSFRVLGIRAGITVLALDMLKGTAAGLLPLLFHSSINPMLVGIGAILGHTFSIWIGFKGGKAVATSAGVLLAYNPIFFIIIISIFVILLSISSMVSLSSMISFSCAVLISLYYHDWILTIVATILTIFVFYRHRTNISRIRNGTESTIPFGWYYNHKKSAH